MASNERLLEINERLLALLTEETRKRGILLEALEERDRILSELATALLDGFSGQVVKRRTDTFTHPLGFFDRAGRDGFMEL